MTADVAPEPTVGRRIIWVAAGLAFAAFATWLGSLDLIPALHDSARGRGTVEFRPYLFMALPIALSGLAFAAMEVAPRTVPTPRGRGRGRGPRGQPRAAMVLLVLLAAGAILVPFAPMIGRFMLGDVLADRGYRACAAPEGRRPPMRWVRVDLACPA